MVAQTTTGTIFCAGGNEKGVADNSSEYYDWASQQWKQAAAMKRKRSDFGLVSAYGKVFAVGGWADFGKRLSSVEVYDPEKDRWRRCASMCVSRSQVTVCQCHCDGSIYAIGGESRGNVARRVVERYDAHKNRWTKAPKMNDRRWSACCCSRKEDGCLYVVGGYDELSGGALSTCERYDPRAGQWMKIANMGQKRCGAALAVLESGDVCVVGGTNEKMAQLATCECYNPQADRWEALPSMKYPRNFFGVAPFDNGRLLYAVGGADFVEIYDPRTYTWTISEVQMGRKRSRHGVVWCDWTWNPLSECEFPEKEWPKVEESSVDIRDKTEDLVSQTDHSEMSMQL